VLNIAARTGRLRFTEEFKVGFGVVHLELKAAGFFQMPVSSRLYGIPDDGTLQNF